MWEEILKAKGNMRFTIVTDWFSQVRVRVRVCVCACVCVGENSHWFSHVCVHVRVRVCVCVEIIKEKGKIRFIIMTDWFSSLLTRRSRRLLENAADICIYRYRYR